jgi:hypothetical protein
LKLSLEERQALARKRITSVLTSHTIATMRTLEMKISDAGPFNQRIDPHILTDVRDEMLAEGVLARFQAAPNRPPWFYLGNTQKAVFQKRLAVLAPLQVEYTTQSIGMRVGQALEIAVYRSLINYAFDFFGGFPDLDSHDDSKLFSKAEPPRQIGQNFIPDAQLLDFIVEVGDGDWAGVECKNIREWLYPEREELRELISKCLYLNCIPVLIARRIHISTFFVFNKCGVIFHQTYNQRVPESEAELADKVKAKDTLSYFDIKLGNQPDARLDTFIGTNLNKIASEAREKFEAHKDLLVAYCLEGMSYAAFAARVRRRANGQNEDNDFPPE